MNISYLAYVEDLTLIATNDIDMQTKKWGPNMQLVVGLKDLKMQSNSDYSGTKVGNIN